MSEATRIIVVLLLAAAYVRFVCCVMPLRREKVPRAVWEAWEKGE